MSVQRATTSDISPGRVATLPTSTSDQAAQVNISFSAYTGNVTAGLALRYSSITQFIGVGIVPGGASQTVQVVLNGTGTVYASASTTILLNTAYTLYARVDNAGRVYVFLGTAGATPALVASAYLSAADNGAADTSGLMGLWDLNSGTTACTRTYSQFVSSQPGRDAAVFSNRQLEIRADRANRGNSNNVWAPLSSYVGQYLKVPTPIYDDGFANFVIKSSRNDMTLLGTPEPATSAPDPIEAAVSVTPRYAQIADL